MISTIKRILKKGAQLASAKRLIPIEHIVAEDSVLDGKVALISGGSGGIGMAIAAQLYSSGASIVLGGTNQAKLQKCAKKFDCEDRIKTIVMDLSSPERIQTAVSEAVGLFGQIDIYVNSAGTHTDDVDLWSMTPEEYDRVININLRGAFFSAREVAQHMIAMGNGGHILFVNSSRGFEPAWSPYGISKWGLRGMTQGFAQVLLPYGIIVNGIAPGSTATPLIGVKDGDRIDSRENGLGRLALPGEIALWAKMLVASSGDMVVGETVLVSGGRGTVDVR